MKNKLKYIIAVCFFCSTLAVFAQDDDISEDTADGLSLGSDSGDSTGVPIDDYVWILAGLGLVYVWKLRTFAKQG